ncbi:MAG: hypothetical protein C5B60_11840 [Chloroflexi bacterium]|nr:MAG: hypothetical protein C5B60_11840 [Chloroflexota bacterium]
MGARIASIGLRLCFLINLVLGLYFWITGNDALVGLHMLVGILFVISLWAFSAIVGLQTGSVGLVGGSFVLGLLIAILGLTQTSILEGGAHWIVQVVHLLLAIIAIGFAEGYGARLRRGVQPKTA